MAFEKLLEEFKQKTDEVLAMGGPEKLKKQKADGKLNARERIAGLVDKGSFREIGQLGGDDLRRCAWHVLGSHVLNQLAQLVVEGAFGEGHHDWSSR